MPPASRSRSVLPPESRGDMTPMIDIVFLLIIFFMVAMRFRPHEGWLETRLPCNALGCGRVLPDSEPTRLRIALTRAEPEAVVVMARERTSYDGIAGVGRRLGNARWRMRFEVAGATVLEMDQETVMGGPERNRPETRTVFTQGGSPVAGAETLYRRLVEAKRRAPAGPVVIAPDRAATYAAFVLGLDACRRAGFEEIRFAVAAR